MDIKYRFLFNFAVSKSAGGLKRLFEFSKWFNKRGGAWFIIHPECIFLKRDFPKNKYFVVFQNRFERIFKDCDYLPKLREEIGQPDLYYSYGIPIYSRFGKINWFHLSNILPLSSNSVKLGLSFFDRFIRLKLLGLKIKRNFKNTDFVSAESNNSLKIIEKQKIKNFFLSINGSDDEIDFLRDNQEIKKNNMAVVVGTQKYKGIMDAYLIFNNLKKKNKDLKLLIVGSIKHMPKEIINNDDIILTGQLRHLEVIEILKRTKFYISSTKIENSFNAASEGIFLADESYISDIDPHKELLENETFERVSFSQLNNSSIKVRRKDLKGKNLKLWSDVVDEIVQKVKA